MNLTVTKVDFKNNKSLVVDGIFINKPSNLIMCIYQRIDTIDFMKPLTIKVYPQYKEDKFQFVFNIEEYSNILEKGHIWDIELRDNETVMPLYMLDNQKLIADYITLYSGLKEGKPYITAKGRVAIWVKDKISFNINHPKIERDDSKIRIIFSFQQEEMKLDNKKLKICFKKQVQNNLELYCEQLIFDVEQINEKEYSCIINKEDLLSNELFIKNEVWECFFHFENRNNEIIEYKITVYNEKLVLQDNFEILIEDTNLYIKKLIIEKNGTIRYVLNKKNIEARLISLDFDSEANVKLSGKCEIPEKEFEICKMYIKNRRYNNTFIEEYGYINIPVTINKNEFDVNFNLDKYIENIFLEDGTIIDMYIQLFFKKENRKLDVPLDTKLIKNINFNYKNIENTNFHIKPYRTAKNTLSFFIKKQVVSIATKPIRIAILGSCYSRTAFVSKLYFNPNYKEKYEVVYTQFHSSIPSIMSNPTKYNEDLFQTLNPTHQQYVKNDFEKNILEDLRKVNPDYIIMDLYADAVRDLILFDEDHIITGSFLLKDSQYLYKLKDSDKIITHENIEEFMSYWIPSVKKFKEKLLEFFPEEKVILQKARMIDRYLDKNKKLNYYQNNQYLINRSNFYFELMENLILNEMPKMKTIDINNYNFIGDENFPYGHSTNHYESGYYKELIKQLDNIVLKDMCNISI